jgi:transposase
MNISTIGIDIGKNWFHLVGRNRAGRTVARHKFTRTQLHQFLVNTPSCVIGMEACSGSQNLARKFQSFGHEVRLIAPKFIKAYLKNQKNDFNDAEAIAEATTRPSMRFVAIKSSDQLDLQALHRIRHRWVAERTATINQLRGFLIEYGIPVRQGRSAFEHELPRILDDASNGISVRMRGILSQLREHWRTIEQRLAQCTGEIETLAKDSEDCQRLTRVPGIGPLGATALVAAIGNGSNFANGRQLAAWLGLVPRQWSTGGKTKLLGIGKHGNSYIRTLFIHGARSCVRNLKRQRHAFGTWLTRLEARANKNVVAVALANKIARIAWAVLIRREDYRLASVSSI